jgi:hypothetical protein
MSNELPRIPAEAKEIIKNKAAFNADVADPNTGTTEEDFSQHVEITVAKLTLFGSTKK